MPKITVCAALTLALVSTSAALAADPPVVLQPAPEIVVSAGPVYVISVESKASSPGTGASGETLTVLDIRAASGWGVKLETFVDGGVNPIASYATGRLLARLYRAAGNATVGVFASGIAGVNSWSPTVTLGGIGFDADYRTESVTLTGLAEFTRRNGTAADFRIAGTSRVLAGEHLVLSSAGWVGRQPTVTFGHATGRVGFRLGPLTPFVGATQYFGPGAGTMPVFGADFELTVADGALTLLASTRFDYTLGFGFVGWEANTGFAWIVSGGPVTIRGNARFSTGSVVGTLGIGLRFGTGQITGFTDTDYRL